MRQINEAPKVQLFAQSETEFFVEGVDAQVRFALDPQGRVTTLTLRNGGRESTARKIE